LLFVKTPAHREINNIAAAISIPICYRSRGTLGDPEASLGQPC
jgi:hypothetical protein